MAGLVKPWVNVELADGGIDFRSQHTNKAIMCWQDFRCQVDGQALGKQFVLMGGPDQLRSLLFDEPAMHPECAGYVAQACPMVGGRLTHYAKGDSLSAGRRGKTCPQPGCNCGGWVEGHKTRALAGSPAHDWFAVHAIGYTVAVRPNGQVIGAALETTDVVNVMKVSVAGEGYVWEPAELPADLDPEIRKGRRG